MDVEVRAAEPHPRIGHQGHALRAPDHRQSFSGCELDAQGRVLLPATLRAKVGMDKAIRFVGMGQYLEIWDEQRYLGECGVSEGSIDELLDYVNGQYYHAQT